MSNPSSPHIVVLGAGPCGLYAARVLTQQGYRVSIIEKQAKPGGLATSHFYNNNWYDMGVHMFHAFDQEIFNDVKTMMAEERIEVDLNAKIKWAGGFFRYPLQFQDMIKGIPFFKLTYQVLNLFTAQIKNSLAPKTAVNAEEALIQLYGRPLYEFFFEEFTHNYWGIHPQQLSATFISTKMPKLTAVDVLKKGLEKIGIKEKVKATESALTQETLHYSRTGAETMPRRVAAAITAAGGEIYYNAEVKQVIADNNNHINQIVFQQGTDVQTIACDGCVSTIPINNLVNALQPTCPIEVEKAAQFIRYKPIVIYGLLVDKPQCLDSLYIYYRNRIFHRVGEPKNAGVVVNPPNYTTLIVEMTCEVGDDKWLGTAAIKEQILAQLAEEGICEPHQVREIHLSHSETGYPIFDLGFEPHLATIKNYLQQFVNLQSTGRQGAFTYPNMHSAMRMGAKAAEALMTHVKSATI